MKASRLTLAVLITLAAAAGTARASWYDDYEAGLAAVRKGDWRVVVDRMTKAIAGNPKEENRARTYGAIFINYHPFYYRGVAYLNTGRYDEAIADLEKTTGPGPENLGSIDMLMQMAKMRQQQASEPAPQPPPPVPQPRPTPPPAPVPQPVIPAPVPQPAAPVMDPALRTRAQSAINQARSRIDAARERDAAATPEYRRSVSELTDASKRLAAARTNEDLNAVITLADSAAFVANSAVKPVRPGSPSSGGADVVMAESSRRVREALEAYFRGDFDEAASLFADLSSEMPRNGWIWAFLGAARYSQWAFEANEDHRREAEEAFRKARQHGKWGRDGLPSKYFSRRIRNAYNQTAG